MNLYWDVKQGSLEWKKLRRGKPTASAAHRIITPGKGLKSAGRKKYLAELVLERLKNWQPDSIDMLEHVSRGKQQEDDAVFAFEMANKVDTKVLGFVTTDDGLFGASPDRVIVDGMIPTEIKCPSESVHMEYILFGLGDDYKCQVQAQIMTMEADKAAFHAYNVGIPKDFTLWTPRDDVFIGKFQELLREFCEELDTLTATARSWGVWEEYQWRDAFEREHQDNIRGGPEPTEAELDALINGPLGEKLDWGA